MGGGVKTGAAFLSPPPLPPQLWASQTRFAQCKERGSVFRLRGVFGIGERHTRTHTETICSVNAAPALKTEVGGKERRKIKYIYIPKPTQKQARSLPR